MPRRLDKASWWLLTNGDSMETDLAKLLENCQKRAGVLCDKSIEELRLIATQSDVPKSADMRNEFHGMSKGDLVSQILGFEFIED